MPAFAYGGGNLRMYGLVPGCALLVWYDNRNWFAMRARTWLIWAMVCEVVTAFLHAIEFFFVGFIVIAACLECRTALPAPPGMRLVCANGPLRRSSS